MFGTQKIKQYIAFGLLLAFFWITFPADLIAGLDNPFSDIEDRLTKLSDKEGTVLKKLFSMAQELEELEITEEETVRDLEKGRAEIQELQTRINKEEAAWKKRKEDLRQVLLTYQRMGPGSYMEIILDSGDLATFIRRLNILRDITRNTGELMGQLELSKDRLTAEKAKMDEKLAQLKDKQEELQKSIAAKKKLKDELEKYLASLAEEKEHYQKYLEDIQKLWSELKPQFTQAVGELSGIIKEGNLPPEALKLDYNFFSIKGTIDEKSFNDVVSGKPRTLKMVFDLKEDQIELKFPDKGLVLTGKLVVEKGHTLVFEPEAGSFYGLPLGGGAMEELFSEKKLVLELEPLLEKNVIQSVEVGDGYLILHIIAKF